MYRPTPKEEDLKYMGGNGALPAAESSISSINSTEHTAPAQ